MPGLKGASQSGTLKRCGFTKTANAWRFRFRFPRSKIPTSALLVESRQRLALATESARIGIWDWDVAADKMIWDKQMYELYGIREQDFSHAVDAWQKGLHPEDRSRAEAEIAAALDGSKNFDTEFRARWPNGEIRDIEAHGVVHRAKDGSGVRMIGVNWDITGRKRAESALRGSNEKFHQLADNITDVFWIRSPDMRELQYISPAFERIWGRTAESLIANPLEWSNFILPEDRGRAMEAFAALTEDAQCIDIEYRIVRPDGEIRWVRIPGVFRSASQPSLAGAPRSAFISRKRRQYWLGLLTELESCKKITFEVGQRCPTESVG